MITNQVTYLHTIGWVWPEENQYLRCVDLIDFLVISRRPSMMAETTACMYPGPSPGLF